ncbi:o-succinylbenzoate--CoA ligase [Actinokineospora sp. UTMC 2448]|uniref:o-succinylbenzoate--CoA ligase n=1 Tax=Actinokineospora sp. UTMC 2448 TaxID=2268449 RepID=UPI0021646733|nr:o-succinylbenzoate--CoA ligase [Actinokineospora sp. UTMC 2448]UVS82271.1 2-succinylbenzoate--CoA ligase [Actinokineospora sp. UTMC 2448]
MERLRAVLESSGVWTVRTSGSTGTPKTVLLSASCLLASAHATHARLGGPGAWLLALPTDHIAGLQVQVRSLVAGTVPSVLTGPFRGPSFVAAASAVPADGPRYTSLVPTQLTRVLSWGGSALAALRSFDAVLVGGAALASPVLDAAREAGVRVVTTYGMTETAGGCVYDGVPLDGVSVELVDGVIRIGGPTVAIGYADSPPFDGWFTTSDLGEFVGGRLRVLGRADDVINTGGEKVAPASVEAVLLAQPGVREVCVVGVPDPEWGQRVAAAVVGDLTETALSAVRTALGAAAVPRRVAVVDALPEKDSGKVDRAAVALMFAE